jgi:hypothetical protein
MVAAALMLGLPALAPGVPAQTASVTYDLKDVWLLPDISHPRTPARPMTGTFVWTYTPGQFENGSGKFLNLSIPWWGTRTSPAKKISIQPKSIEITMIGNYHGYGLDITMQLQPPLSPDKVSPIDRVRSKFHVEVGVAYEGHFTGGTIVPRCPPPTHYGTGSPGSGAHVPTLTASGGESRLGNGSFRIDGDRLLGGSTCFLLLGTKKSEIPLAGINLLVDPGSWILFLPVPAGGKPGVPGVGTLRIPMPVPNDPRLIALELYFQVVAIDPGSPKGIAAASDGLSVVICGAGK